jgi:hypothetical protein
MLTYSTCMHVILNSITNECLTTVPCCVSHITVAPILVNDIDHTLNSFVSHITVAPMKHEHRHVTDTDTSTPIKFWKNDIIQGNHKCRCRVGRRDAPSIRSVGATKLHCEAVSLVSAKALNWVEINFITPQICLCICWTNEVKPIKLKRGYMFIWHATIWMIWRARNNITCRNCELNWKD